MIEQKHLDSDMKESPCTTIHLPDLQTLPFSLAA